MANKYVYHIHIYMYAQIYQHTLSINTHFTNAHTYELFGMRACKHYDLHRLYMCVEFSPTTGTNLYYIVTKLLLTQLPKWLPPFPML